MKKKTVLKKNGKTFEPPNGGFEIEVIASNGVEDRIRGTPSGVMLASGKSQMGKMVSMFIVTGSLNNGSLFNMKIASETGALLQMMEGWVYDLKNQLLAMEQRITSQNTSLKPVSRSSGGD